MADVMCTPGSFFLTEQCLKKFSPIAITNELTTKGALPRPTPHKVKMIESTSSFAAPPSAFVLMNWKFFFFWVEMWLDHMDNLVSSLLLNEIGRKKSD
jgi:hypothetical protein